MSKPEEALVHPQLGLASEAVVDAGEHHDELVAGVGGLADQADVVGGLPGLDLADDKPFPAPTAGPGWVLQLPEHPVGGVVEPPHHLPGHQLDFFEVPAVTVPEVPAALAPGGGQPFDVVGGVLQPVDSSCHTVTRASASRRRADRSTSSPWRRQHRATVVAGERPPPRAMRRGHGQHRENDAHRLLQRLLAAWS